MNLQRLQQLAGMPVTPAQTLTEAKSKLVKLDPVEMQEYKGSDEFEDAMATIFDAVKHARSILESQAYKHWMRESQKFGFSMSNYTNAVTKLEKAEEGLENLYEALANASE